MRSCVPAASVIVIACAANKLAHAAPARDLYDSANFRLMLGAAESAARAQASTTVAVLSAKHGLLRVEQVIAPYELTMAASTSIPAYELSTQIAQEWTAVRRVHALLPRRYLRRLREAVALLDEAPTVTDQFAGARGNGDQRAMALAFARGTPSPPSDRANVPAAHTFSLR